VEVETDPKSDSLGVNHTPPTWLLPIMDFPQPHYRSVDQNIEPYRNAWESQVENIKIHENASHVEIESSSNPMDPPQDFLLHEVWTIPTWAFVEALVLAPHLAILPTLLHVHNHLNMSLYM
jgi:hypothetical protein